MDLYFRLKLKFDVAKLPWWVDRYSPVNRFGANIAHECKLATMLEF
jgi:hypothetical protein